MPPKRKAKSTKATTSKKMKKTDSSESSSKSSGSVNLLPDNWYRNSESKIFIGAHVSISGGLYKSVLQEASIGGQAIGLFLCNQRTWNVAKLTKKDEDEFINTCKEYGYPSHLIVPHGSYLVNIGSPDKENRKKSIDLLLDGVRRCERLNIDLYNIHPGSSLGKITSLECCENIAEAINHVHEKTERTIIVLENMCKQGHTVGGDFRELKTIIDQVNDKKRIGVCLDTCHAFAAGYDLSTKSGFEKMMKDFEEIIGFNYLKAIHLNDSKGKCGSKLDRHEQIGKGLIGINGLKRVVNEPTFQNIPMILETPYISDEVYKEEIETLYNFIS